MNISEPCSAKCVLLDLPSDKNRGDAAMHLSLIRLLKQRFKKSNITILSWYGANQKNSFSDEYLESLNEDVNIIPGLRYTYYDFPSFGKNRLKKIKIFLSLVLAFTRLFFLSMNLNIYRLLLKNDEKEALQKIIDADYIVWNGRNFRGSSKLSEIYTAIILTYHSLICILLKKSIYCLGVSVWNYESDIAKRLVAFCFRKCEVVTVRESVSLEIMAKDSCYSEVNYRYSPDLSLLYISDYSNSAVQHETKCVGLTIVDWNKGDANIVKNYAQKLGCILGWLFNKGYKVIVTPQVTTAGQNNKNAINQMLASLDDNFIDKIELIEGEVSVENLCRWYSECDFMIATRMHSAIFAAAVGTPSVCIAYDHGSKWGIVEDFGAKVFNYEDFEPEEVMENISILISDNRCSDYRGIEKFNHRLGQIQDHFIELDMKISR